MRTREGLLVSLVSLATTVQIQTSRQPTRQVAPARRADGSRREQTRAGVGERNTAETAQRVKPIREDANLPKHT
jgi:hypothetical protein